MRYPRLFIGPMSKQIVDIAAEYSLNKEVLGLIPSRRQVEYTGGYVNNWTTSEFARYVKNLCDNIVIVRDHGGPAQGNNLDDGCDSFKADIRSEFDLIHIDPWKTCKTPLEAAGKTAELIRFCCSLSDKIEFEVGTEEAIFPYSAHDLDMFLGDLARRLGDLFIRIKFAVIQSGVKISGTRNIGAFSGNRLERMVSVAHRYSLYAKEHNGDYLTYKQIRQRTNLGLDSINIAPEFGVTQTQLMIDCELVNMDDAYKCCLHSGKYAKWIPDELKDNPPRDLVIRAGGHYCYTSYPFNNSIEKIRSQLKNSLFKRFDEIHAAWK